MALRASHTKKRRFPALVAGLFAAVVAVAGISVFMLQPAVASYDVDSTTIGIGEQVNTAEDEKVTKTSGRLKSTAQSGSQLTTSAARTITVKNPDPVIVISAYDNTNESTTDAALDLGTTKPKPTAPHILPDEDDGWMVGSASAYSFACNDDGKGNFGTTATASGVPLSDTGLTVAVPAEQADRIGDAVAIRYGETIIVATVTDTGGFAEYGRALDLAPGCWKAFGASDTQEWGVRDVYYKFL